ncbi:MAG: ATP-binding protein [Myxococcales bacterium]|nr:ATP-binding protein [Myxococcales bacterium]
MKLPSRSFFLFGPRATGKTTWLRERLPNARWYNLLLESELVRLLRDRDQFRREVAALRKGSWVVVDEVQKLPALLDDVHEILSRPTLEIRFALTGSSARKLRRGQANLLAGRAVTRAFFPLVAAEFGFDFEVDDLLAFGCLPQVREETVATERIDLLDAYGTTYLTEEVRAEALVKNLAPFVRFLEVAALMNGQVTNVSSISRDAGVARPTVQGFFEVLVDTFIASWLPAFRPRARVKEVVHPKFFFFDSGVVRSLARRLREPLAPTERGPLLETYLLHELRAYVNDSGIGGELSYWRTPSGSEVDFIWSRGGRHVAIEVRASERWREQESRSLKELAASVARVRPIAVYLGSTPLKDERVEVLPLASFLRALEAGEILS